VSEGALSPSDVATDLAKHVDHGTRRSEHEHWLFPVIEASLLAMVALLAAWSGYSSAKWSTESRLELAEAATLHTKASNNELAALSQRNFDASTFEAWFTAWTLGDPHKEEVAEHRFTANFQRAFDAWMATNPLTNPKAPPGPTYMPQYRQPRARLGTAQNKRADTLFDEGSLAGQHSDDYVRATVYLATVLFLVAISGHFRIRKVRIGLILVGVLMLTFAVIDLASLPLPPT
jgi:hypothetical protein